MSVQKLMIMTFICKCAEHCVGRVGGNDSGSDVYDAIINGWDNT